MHDLFPQFLGQVLTSSFAHPAIAFDTIMFLQDNKETLVFKTKLLTTFFPNLFKVTVFF